MLTLLNAVATVHETHKGKVLATIGDETETFEPRATRTSTPTSWPTCVACCARAATDPTTSRLGRWQPCLQSDPRWAQHDQMPCRAAVSLEKPMTDIDVLSVGDTATDVFIRLMDTHVREVEDDRGRWLDLPFGGKVPFEYAVTVHAGGNAANAAVGLARLGLSSALAAHVGDDQIGRDMEAALQAEGVETHLVRRDPGRQSNRNFVLWFDQDRTILVRHELFDYHWPQLGPGEVPDWVYLSSVGSDAPGYYGEIVAWLDVHPTVRLAFQPGTFQIARAPRPGGIYGRAEVLVCNREEAVEIGGGDHGRISEILDSLHRIGPRSPW